jgi:glycosyltransferase involved in cell wall biosynthesis
MSVPAVTVLVPSYNYARYLPGALHSASAQTFGDYELLIVEDGSTDQSPAIARAFAARDARVRILTHADGRNHGLSASLALGLAAARGRWTAFLEADDQWLPECLERRLAAASTSNAGVVLNDITLLPEPGTETSWYESYVPRVMRGHALRARAAAPTDGSAENCVPLKARIAARAAVPVGATGPEDGDATSRCPTFNGAPPDNATRNGPAVYTVTASYTFGTAFYLENIIPTFSCAMVRTDLLRRVSFDTPASRWLDWWVWAQLATFTAFAFVPEKLTQWRLHPKSWNGKVEPRGYMRDYRAMGRGLRRILAGSPVRAGRLGAAAFLRLPAELRLAARLALPLAEDGPILALRRIWSRLRFSGECATPVSDGYFHVFRRHKSNIVK